MKDILQRLKELKTERLVSRIKHLRGRHDQRDHNRWPAGYQAQVYVPTGRRAGVLSARATGGLAGLTQTNIMMNQTKRIPPKVKTGTVSDFAPMPIDESEFKSGGRIYQYIESLIPAYKASKIATDEFESNSEMTESFRSAYIDMFGTSNDEDIDGVGWIRSLERSIVIQQPAELRDDYDFAKRPWVGGRVGKFNDLVQNIKDEEEKISALRNEINTLRSPNYANSADIDLTEQIEDFQSSLRYFENYSSNNSWEEQMRKMMFPDQKSRSEILADELRDKENALRSKLMEMHQDSAKVEEDIAYITQSMAISDELSQLQNSKKNLEQEAKELYQEISPYVKINNPFTELKLEAKKMRKSNIFRFLMPRQINDAVSTADIASLLYTNNADTITSDYQEFANFINKMTQTINDAFNNDFSAINDMDDSIFGSEMPIQDVLNNLTTGVQEIGDAIDFVLQKFEQSKNDAGDKKPSEEEVTEAMRAFFQTPSKNKIVTAKQIQRALSFIYDSQSFNGTPTVVSWSEIINPTTNVQTDENENPVVHWRSVKGVSNQDPEGIDRGMQYVEDMRSGETHYPGTGVSGYGTYMKTSNIYGDNFSYTETASTEDMYKRIKDNIGDAENTYNMMMNILKSESFGIPSYIVSEFKDDLERFFTDTKDGIDFTDQTGMLLDFVNATRKMLQSGSPYAHPMGILSGLQKRLSEISVPKEQRMKMMKLKSLFNELYNTLSTMANDKKAMSVSDARYADLQSTRELYGDYTAGYTINADARIPMGPVNGYNKGNHGHYSFVSLDAEIDSEFRERYPMLNPREVNIGIKMAMLGYDMYRAHVNDYSTNIVVLNRAILNMSDGTIEKGSSDDDIRNIVNAK